MLIGKGILRTGKVMQSQPVINFEIQKYYQKEPKFNGVFSGNNLPEIKDGDYLINLDKYKSIGTHQIVLYVNGDNATYFDSFEVEHTPKDIKKSQKIKNENVPANVYRRQAYNSIMYECFCIACIDFILRDKISQIILIQLTNMKK